MLKYPNTSGINNAYILVNFPKPTSTKNAAIQIHLVKDEMVFYIFNQLFGCTKTNFGSLKRTLPNSTNANHSALSRSTQKSLRGSKRG